MWVDSSDIFGSYDLNHIPNGRFLRNGTLVKDKGSKLKVPSAPVGLSNYSDEADWEVLNELIGCIYDCVLHPEQWNDTLGRISAALCPLNWESSFLIWESSNPPRARFVAANGLAAGVQEMYTAVYAGDNPWSKRIAQFRSGSVIDTDEIMSREEFSDSALSRDFLGPWGIGRLVAVLLDRRGGERLGLIMPGPADREIGGLKRGLRVLAPHLQRALRISHRLASLELAADAAIVAANSAPFAIFSLDQDLSILAANERGAAYEKAGIIQTISNKLSFVDVAAHQKLVTLQRSLPPTGIAFQALDSKARDCPVLGARIEPNRAKAIGGVYAGAALIITLGSSPGETPVVEIDRVAQWYGLTPTEARLAVAITSGQSVQDYAAERAISTNAARFLLKGIFRKTNVSSQAQLVAMLAKLPT